MAIRKKDAERTALEQLEAEDVASFGEDPELLDPAEEAALASGNAQGSQTHNREETTQTAGPAQETPSESGDQPVQAQEADQEREERETLSDEQVRTMGSSDRVPAWSLVKERQENRALKRSLDDLARKLAEQEEKWNRASERLRHFQERAGIEAARPAVDPEPDAKADPQAHYQWELRQHRRALETLNQQQQVSTAQAQAAQHQAVLSGLEQQFILAGHPDYYERVNFLRKRRNRELELMGYTDGAERSQIIANEAAMLVNGAVRQGRNPALVAHELSEQWGYKAPSADNSEAAVRAGAVQSGNGSSFSAADRIRDLQRKKAASTSLQAIASRPADGPLTLEDIAEMDDDAYERYVEKNGGDLAALFRSGR